MAPRRRRGATDSMRAGPREPVRKAQQVSVPRIGRGRQPAAASAAHSAACCPPQVRTALSVSSSRYRTDCDTTYRLVNSLRKYRKSTYHTDYHDVRIAERRSRQRRRGKRSVLPVSGVAAVGQAPSNSEPIRSGRPPCTRGHRPVRAVDNASVRLARSHVHTGFAERLRGAFGAGGAAA